MLSESQVSFRSKRNLALYFGTEGKDNRMGFSDIQFLSSTVIILANTLRYSLANPAILSGMTSFGEILYRVTAMNT